MATMRPSRHNNFVTKSRQGGAKQTSLYRKKKLVLKIEQMFHALQIAFKDIRYWTFPILRCFSKSEESSQPYKNILYMLNPSLSTVRKL